MDSLYLDVSLWEQRYSQVSEACFNSAEFVEAEAQAGRIPQSLLGLYSGGNPLNFRHDSALAVNAKNAYDKLRQLCMAGGLLKNEIIALDTNFVSALKSPVATLSAVRLEDIEVAYNADGKLTLSIADFLGGFTTEEGAGYWFRSQVFKDYLA